MNDPAFFPETDERSSYSSPLSTINQELRRQNVVAAAATSGPRMSLQNSSDPWGSEDLLDDHHLPNKLDTCSCPRRQQHDTICPTCGKQVTSVAEKGSPSRGGANRPSRTLRLAVVQDPQHAQALLQSTPQLRYLSPSSMDMQGVGSVKSSNPLLGLLSPQSSSSNAPTPDSSTTVDYRASLVRDRANRQAATELASLLWILAHEMSLDDYGAVESNVFKSVFALVHASDNDRRMAGLAALDALIGAPSADEEKKAIKFANALSTGLRTAQGDYEFLSAVSTALGHMAMRTANVDFVESEVTRALEWLRTERSDRRLAAALSLKEFAIHAPTAFHSKTSQTTLGQGGSNEFLDHIFEALRDLQPIVRACSADALSQCLKILMERQHPSLTGLLCQVYFALLEGIRAEDPKKKKSVQAIAKTEAAQHGSLLVVATMIAHTGEFMLPRFDEVCTAVLAFTKHPKALMRLEVIRLIPRLAQRCPQVFGRRYLQRSLEFLIESASSPTPPRVRVNLRPSAFTAIGQLVLAMTDPDTGIVIGGAAYPTVTIMDDPEKEGATIVELSKTGSIYEKLGDIFALVRRGLTSSKGTRSDAHSSALHCAADLVQALKEVAVPHINDLINDMFRAGLSNDLIQCVHAIAECVPAQQSIIEDRLLQEVSLCLAGISSARDICDPLSPFRVSLQRARAARARQGDLQTRPRPVQLFGSEDSGDGTRKDAGKTAAGADPKTDSLRIRINMSESPEDVSALVLSLQTLGTFGEGRLASSGTTPLLPFVQDVAAPYLSHPSSEVRHAAALTCCSLLIPPGVVHIRRASSYSGLIIEDVLETLLRVSVSDPSPVVRLCIVRALDDRYDPFLCHAHHLQPLYLSLQDEALVIRAAGLQLLGRLTVLNPAPILPVLRRFLVELILELQCGVDTGRSREEATRLLVVFLRSKPLQRLVHPVLPAVVSAIPMKGATPRLASASMEALGELAQATGTALQPWVKDVVPHILETMQDQSSASKQRTSLRTLGQIAGSTSYVIRPYLDYPQLLSQATDVLPGTKRAPWALRREVIRTLGILGALDPDRYHSVAPKTRKGGAVGGAYFVGQEENEAPKENSPVQSRGSVVLRAGALATSTGAGQQPAAAAIGSHAPGRVRPSKPAVLPAPGRAQAKQGSERAAGMAENDDDLPAHLSMYEQYAMVAQPVSSLPPARRMSPSDENFYPTVVIQALMRIFKEPTLAVHHLMVMQAIMFIFQSLGLRSVTFLGNVVPHMLHTIRTCSQSSLRESLLKQIATLSGIVREHLRPYVADIFDVVEQFWSSRHLGTIFVLISKIAVGVPDEFRRFVPRLIGGLITSLDEIQVADWLTNDSSFYDPGVESEKLGLILRSIRNLRGVLGEHLHVLVPALLKLADSLAIPHGKYTNGKGTTRAADSTLVDLSVLTLQTTSAMLESTAENVFWDQVSVSSSCGLPARAVQPLVRLLREKSQNNKAVGMAIIETILVCARQLGGAIWMKLYDKSVRHAIEEWQKTVGAEADLSTEAPNAASHTNSRRLSGLDLYDEFLIGLKIPPMERSSGLPNPFQAEGIDQAQRRDRGLQVDAQIGQADNPVIAVAFDNASDVFDYTATQYQPSLNATSKPRVNQRNLQRAWDVSQRASHEDWDEWMRRLAIQLLKEAPSPSLRAAASLAHAYQPLARELFSAAFVCSWKELSEPYRRNLVHALETAFVADVSPEILQTLLNLAEFMEHDSSGGLPIDISILADLALKCRAYAKALHYKEREHNMGGGGACVEALISINRKLDLQDAALGVLKSATTKLERRGLGSDMSVREQFSSHFVRHHHAQDLFYSVISTTDDPTVGFSGPVDVAERQESWLAKLGSWNEALAAYQRRLSRNPSDFEAILGCMRCLDASGEWRQVLDLAERSWPTFSGYHHDEDRRSGLFASPRDQKKALRLCAQAAWRLGRWDGLEKYASKLVQFDSPVPAASAANLSQREGSGARVDFDGAFYSAVLYIHRQEWVLAAQAIDAARKAMDSRFTALMAESYNRAYPSMVTAQTLAEMEEIIQYRQLEAQSLASAHRHPANRPDADEARERLLSVWKERLAGCSFDAEVHSSILAVRSLVLGPTDDVEATLSLSDLSRQAQWFRLAERVLIDPLLELGADLNGPAFGFGLTESFGLGLRDITRDISAPVHQIIEGAVLGDSSAFMPNYESVHDQLSKSLVMDAGGLDRLMIQYKLYFAYLKHLYLTDRRDEAMGRLDRLCSVVDLVSHCENVKDNSLRVACWLEMGEWKLEAVKTPSYSVPESLQIDVLAAFRRATEFESAGEKDYRAWHAWSLLNFRLALQMSEKDDGSGNTGRWPQAHVVAAVKGFVTAISVGTKKWSASVQQDMLNLLTCLFKYGDSAGVAEIINRCLGAVAVEAWLGVLPQLLARIHIKSPSVRSVLHPLLIRLGEKHPQALMYPLSVLIKSPVAERRIAAESLMVSLKAHSSALVDQALMVSSELIRVAILWLETWHEGLEDASRLYFGESNVSGMLDLLQPLHEQLERGAETRRESDFIKAFGQDLAQAHKHIKEYVRLVSEGRTSVPNGSNSYDPSGRTAPQSEEAQTAMNKAWDIYYTVFRRINKQLPSLTKLELSQCSPALSNARSLELGVPGSYRVDGSFVRIEEFVPSVQVITSKQRPRKITLRGSDGKDYVFLLKGHEDLRQDERVMQLFGLVNALLVRDRQTKKHDLSIQRYAICPLSHNCGIVGWVPHCDTLHSLIRDYRQSKKIPLNMENREMLKIAPDYDLLTVMQKVEVFTDALRATTGKGNDLYEILWLKSTTSEEWLERRTKFTRSLAVMSMVGYILGLGDRHPSNLMLDKLSGRVLHIDFGDCFEVAMNRDKYPEKVPFRLTRMLVKAMEVSGIEGSYRSTCERTMTVLRESRDSLVAMLEAFVYDPLISWRLVDLSTVPTSGLAERGQNRNRSDGDRAIPENALNEPSGVPIDTSRRISINPITEHPTEDSGDEAEINEPNPADDFDSGQARPLIAAGVAQRDSVMSNTSARSLQMFSNIQNLAANLTSDSRIASIAGEGSEQAAAEGSIARSRIERSMRQRELMSLLEGEEGAANEEALNERALKVIRRVQDKLTGTDYPDRSDSGEPLAVPDQVQRLIIQATSSENLCQLFIGWCAFW